MFTVHWSDRPDDEGTAYEGLEVMEMESRSSCEGTPDSLDLRDLPNMVMDMFDMIVVDILGMVGMKFGYEMGYGL